MGRRDSIHLGGTAPLRWMVNGEMLPQTDFLETAFWKPSGQGYAEIVVIDAEGRTARSNVKVIDTKGVVSDRRVISRH